MCRNSSLHKQLSVHNYPVQYDGFQCSCFTACGITRDDRNNSSSLNRWNVLSDTGCPNSRDYGTNTTAMCAFPLLQPPLTLSKIFQDTSGREAFNHSDSCLQACVFAAITAKHICQKCFIGVTNHDGKSYCQICEAAAKDTWLPEDERSENSSSLRVAAVDLCSSAT